MKTQLSRMELGLLVSNLFYLLYAVLTARVDPYAVSIALAVNAAGFLWLIRALRVMASQAAPVFVLLTASLLAAAVFVVSPLNIMGVLWAVEGAVLVFVGFHFRQVVIRLEGYGIFAVAALSLLWRLIAEISPAALDRDPSLWADLVMFGVLLFLLYRIIDRFSMTAEDAEAGLSFGVKESFTLWAMATLLVVAASLGAGSVLTPLILLPLLFGFWQTSRHGLLVSPLASYLLLAVFAGQLLDEVLSRPTRLLVDQQGWTLLGLAELLIFGLGLQWFFEYSGMQRSPYYSIARYVRTVTLLMPLALIGSALASLPDLPRGMAWWLWLDLVIALGVLLLARPVFQRLSGLNVPNGVLHLRMADESLSAAAAVLFLYTVSRWSLEAMYVSASLAFALLLYRGVRNNLRVTECLGWLHLLILAVGILQGMTSVDSWHFSDQSMMTRLTMLVLLVCAWAGPWVYDRADGPGALGQVARFGRTAAYVVLPLVFLPSVNRHFPEFLVLAVWMSFALTWVMHRYLQASAQRVELFLLFFIAMGGSLLVSAQAVAETGTGVSHFPPLVTLVFSLLVLGVMHWVERSLIGPEKRPYWLIFWVTLHYVAFCVGAFVFAASWDVGVAALAIGVWYMFVCWFDGLRPLSRSSLTGCYLLGLLLLGLGPFLVLSEVINPRDFASIVTSTVTSIAAVAVLGAALHVPYAHHRVLGHRLGGPVVQMVWFHLVAAAGYLGITNTLFGEWSVAATLCLLLHAVIVLFLTINPRFTPLLRLSLLLYAITAGKLLLHDLNDFGALVRVGALMGVGLILMVAAFYYQKATSRQKTSGATV